MHDIRDVVTYVKRPTMNLGQFISSFGKNFKTVNEKIKLHLLTFSGGILGLFSGMSILSVAELAYWGGRIVMDVTKFIFYAKKSLHNFLVVHVLVLVRLTIVPTE